MQTNHFEVKDISFFSSIAKIPWKNPYFTGFLAGFLYKGKIHRFATCKGAKIRGLHVTDGHVGFEIHSGKKAIKVSGERAEGVTLAAPKFGEMSTEIQESLASKVSIEYSDVGRTVFRGTGENAGLEFVGDIDELVKGL